MPDSKTLVEIFEELSARAQQKKQENGEMVSSIADVAGWAIINTHHVEQMLKEMRADDFIHRPNHPSFDELPAYLDGFAKKVDASFRELAHSRQVEMSPGLSLAIRYWGVMPLLRAEDKEQRERMKKLSCRLPSFSTDPTRETNARIRAVFRKWKHLIEADQVAANDAKSKRMTAVSDSSSESGQYDSIALERKQAIARYKRECKTHGIKVTDEEIAKAANPGWNDRTAVARWKRNDKRSKAAEDKLIRRVLRDKPHLKKT